MSFVLPHKEFEKHESGQPHAVLADIVALGKVATTFNGQTKMKEMVRFVWITETIGKSGKPLQVWQRFNAESDHEKSNISKTIKQILGYVPPPGFDIEQLIGQTRKLWIVRETSADGRKDFANVMGIMPADPGRTVQIPADFIREKFKQQAGQRPAQAPPQGYSAPAPAPTQAYPANPPAPAPVPAGYPPAYYGDRPTGYPPAPQSPYPPQPQGPEVKF